MNNKKSKICDPTVLNEINKLYVEMFEFQYRHLQLLYRFDEERGYSLDTEDIRRRFEKELSKLEDKVSKLNETLQEKQKEYAEDMRTCNGEGENNGE